MTLFPNNYGMRFWVYYTLPKIATVISFPILKSVIAYENPLATTFDHEKLLFDDLIQL